MVDELMVKLTQLSELNFTDLADLCLYRLQFYRYNCQPKSSQKLWKIHLVLRRETLLMLLLAEKIAASNWPTFTPLHATKEKQVFSTHNGHRKTYSWEINLYALLKLLASYELVLHKEFPVLLYLFSYLCKVTNTSSGSWWMTSCVPARLYQLLNAFNISPALWGNGCKSFTAITTAK